MGKKTTLHKDIIRFCKNCNTLLKLNCYRDIGRKYFCSHKCSNYFSMVERWKDPEFKKFIISKHLGIKNPNKAYKTSRNGIKLSNKTRKKISLSMCDKILNGWNPNSKYKRGYIQFDENKNIYYRSSYERDFLINCLNDKINVETCKYKIPYNDIHLYIPDFLIDNKIIIEIKPERRMEDPINIQKFKAARLFCNINNLEFKIMNEKDIYGRY